MPAWVQQLEMESNGKSVSRDGSPLDIATTPVVWGAAGTGCQHSFFQALHQGSDIVPTRHHGPTRTSRHQSCWRLGAEPQNSGGKCAGTGRSPGRWQPKQQGATSTFCRWQAISLISWPSTTPHVLGQLLALYEHVTVVSGFIWNVNSFDQWGVELGKVMALQFSAVLGGERSADDVSATAADLLSEIMTNTPDAG